MKEWHEQTGWEFLRKDEANSKNKQGFIELWDLNIKWLESNSLVAGDLINKYRKKHGV